MGSHRSRTSAPAAASYAPEDCEACLAIFIGSATARGMVLTFGARLNRFPIQVRLRADQCQLPLRANEF